MTRKELLEHIRAEKLHELFLAASQIDTLSYETVSQLESLTTQVKTLERALGQIEESLNKLDQETQK